MSRSVSLDRLRDISKTREIRRPLLIPVQTDRGEKHREVQVGKIEWPIPS